MLWLKFYETPRFWSLPKKLTTHKWLVSSYIKSNRKCITLLPGLFMLLFLHHTFVMRYLWLI
ncbi:hypothetical protein GIB67_005844 [Kingdonia uniflora]|uniref:Uncharacterized protein n=1 Tax=Kingdonia uniflora TaxID=39325 RepID=A0A7J7LU53_9MAGN|nr:hypothetical protein GIB67_005844 [Kingdonia uniflora]